jgi:hypothetical protein
MHKALFSQAIIKPYGQFLKFLIFVNLSQRFIKRKMSEENFFL